MKIENKKNKGMTLFIAVTVTAILLFISFAVVNITIKNTLFASSGRDSQYAFYAADAGLECALYWDSRYKVGPVYDSAFAEDPYPGEILPRIINCGGAEIKEGGPIYGTSEGNLIGLDPINLPLDVVSRSVFSFSMNPPEQASACAVVTVEKSYTNDVPPVLKTRVESKGYNTCEVGNPRRLERGIEMTY